MLEGLAGGGAEAALAGVGAEAALAGAAGDAVAFLSAFSFAVCASTAPTFAMSV